MKILAVIVATLLHFAASILVGVAMSAVTDNPKWRFWAGGYAIMTSGVVALEYWVVHFTMHRLRKKRVHVFPPALAIALTHTLMIVTVYFAAEGERDFRVMLFALPSIPFVIHVGKLTRNVLNTQRE